MQISDSHTGFANPPNTDMPGTLRKAELAELGGLIRSPEPGGLF